MYPLYVKVVQIAQLAALSNDDSSYHAGFMRLAANMSCCMSVPLKTWRLRDLAIGQRPPRFASYLHDTDFELAWRLSVVRMLACAIPLISAFLAADTERPLTQALSRTTNDSAWQR